MKKIIIAIVALMPLLVSCSSTPEPKIIAHRGWWLHEGSAQNSLTSLRLAQEAGFYASEMDTQMTADSIMVVFHDSRIHGRPVSDMTLAEVRQDTTLVNGEKVSTLDTYVATFLDNTASPTRLVVEVKKQNHDDPVWMAESCKRVVKIIKSYDVKPSQLEFISFSWFACLELKRLAPEFKVSYLEKDKSPKEVAAAGLDGVDYYYDVYYVHPTWAEECRQLGLQTNVWTVDYKGIAEDMARFGLDCITTNYPDKNYK